MPEQLCGNRKIEGQDVELQSQGDGHRTLLRDSQPRKCAQPKESEDQDARRRPGDAYDWLHSHAEDHDPAPQVDPRQHPQTRPKRNEPPIQGRSPRSSHGGEEGDGNRSSPTPPKPATGKMRPKKAPAAMAKM